MARALTAFTSLAFIAHYFSSRGHAIQPHRRFLPGPVVLTTLVVVFAVTKASEVRAKHEL